MPFSASRCLGTVFAGDAECLHQNVKLSVLQFECPDGREQVAPLCRLPPLRAMRRHDAIRRIRPTLFCFGAAAFISDSIMLAVQAAVTAAVAVAIASRARKWRLMSAMSGGASQLVAELRLYWVSGSRAIGRASV